MLVSESKPREYFLADSHLKTETGQEFRIAGTFPESGMVTGSYIHVIEHSAFANLKKENEELRREIGKPYDKVDRLFEANRKLIKENEILREALARYEAAKNDVIRYCHPNSDIFWAAKIIGILLNCDFRDSQEEAKEYLQKSEKAEGEWK